MVDASAILWRLRLRGVAVGERWHAPAERWAAANTDSTYAFNDGLKRERAFTRPR